MEANAKSIGMSARITPCQVARGLFLIRPNVSLPLHIAYGESRHPLIESYFPGPIKVVVFLEVKLVCITAAFRNLNPASYVVFVV